MKVKCLLEAAEGCRLQGGDEQLDRALRHYESGLAYLRDFPCRDLWWHAMFTLGVGRVRAGQQHFVSASSHMKDAIGAVAISIRSSSTSDQHEYQIACYELLLEAVASLVLETCLPAASLDAPLDCSTQVTEASEGTNAQVWRREAFHALWWCGDFLSGGT
ncbi:hypothetical protein EON64_12285, partial [archaeon]